MQISQEKAIALSDKAAQHAETAAANGEIIILDVTGMKCAGCVKAVERQLAQYPGVLSACVNLATEVARVECQAGIVDPAALANRLTSTGFPTQPRNSSQNSAINSTSDRHRREIQQQVWRVIVAGILILLSGIGHLSEMGWVELPFIANIWFHWGLATAALIGPGGPILRDGWRSLWRKAPNMNALVGIGTLSAYLASCIALLFPQLGWECFFDEPVMLLGFILLGRTLEHLARRRAAAALEALLSLQPQNARLVPEPAIKEKSEKRETNLSLATFPIADSLEIPVDRVQVGEWLQVLPGEKIPVDGEVALGSTTVDESMLTGESVPVLKQPGAIVVAGTLNQSGALVVRATRTGKDTTLAQIIALVEDAQTRKAPVQQLADTVAGYFTYGVMTIAALTFVFWYFVGTHFWHLDSLAQTLPIAALHHGMLAMTPQGTAIIEYSALLLSLKLAIAVLVIACPCSLGLATPTAILVGTGIGAERGLLIRGGDVLERVHQLDTVVFDKTGTLTMGHPVVTDCVTIEKAERKSLLLPSPFSLLTSNSLLQLAATVESGARHPLAEAIVQEARRLSLPLLEAGDFYTEPGFGVRAEVNGQRVVLGTRDWLTLNNIVVNEAIAQQAAHLAKGGKTVVYVAAGDDPCGLIAVTDRLRPDAKATVERLRQMGLRVTLLTGDATEAADAVARALGITAADVLANIRPDGKAAAIAQLQAQGRRVCMVGDGINDAPALAQSDCGIALQSGTDVAVETAGIVLMQNQLMDVVESIQLSRATFNKIRQNLFWALAYNTLGIPVAAGAFLPGFGIVLSPAAAGAFMAFSSVSVVVNSLLLRRGFLRSEKASASGD